jgi:hypothetical protein
MIATSRTDSRAEVRRGTSTLTARRRAARGTPTARRGFSARRFAKALRGRKRLRSACAASFALRATATSIAWVYETSCARRTSRARRCAPSSATTTSIRAPGVPPPPAEPRTTSSARRPAHTASGAVTAPERAASRASTSEIAPAARAFPSASRTSSSAWTSRWLAPVPTLRVVAASAAAVRSRRPPRARRCIATGTRQAAIVSAPRQDRAVGRLTRPTSRSLREPDASLDRAAKRRKNARMLIAAFGPVFLTKELTSGRTPVYYGRLGFRPNTVGPFLSVCSGALASDSRAQRRTRGGSRLAAPP